MDAARPRVRVHVVGIDDDHRMLLARRPRTRMWTLPWSYLKTGEDPTVRVREMVHETGALPAHPRILGVESTTQYGDHLLDLTFHTTAKRIWKATPDEASALWWSLDEISSLELTKEVRSALVHAWPQHWPHL
ncbi:ADP-ribose pyrophosphatase YjhB (NUDIX family) [Knoellia remsis]|uniref:ADP-ribose pyrophosphatase YjhB (NUDIX family) n=1 Tax=Knoellia remsis TaxID=407159 RepID=A0A2T0UJS4_9MICO|nr:NUDIX domain-containing protein [Knoellia remsis]PRY58108.1 ADP-ribose pyrophosphatase YjhB (NUDIX family) [Knoellia remsis]